MGTKDSAGAEYNLSYAFFFQFKEQKQKKKSVSMLAFEVLFDR